jgi:hypothetical protein
MKWIKIILREVFGLFVDNGSFALAILLWLGAVRWIVPHLNLPGGLPGILLFAGLAVILGESASRYSRQKQR